MEKMTAQAIKFNTDGSLKIMHITDTHLGDENIEMSVFLINEACKRENPDIVIITGDNVHNYDDSSKTKLYINKLMSVFQSLNIPVAVTMGNHDSETGALSRPELMQCYNSYSCSVCYSDDNNISGSASYNIPVLSSKTDEIKFNLWIIDSGDYDNEGHYGCADEDTVQWYKEKSDEITQQNGKKIYSLAFQHIIVPEIYDVLKKTTKRKLYSFHHMYNKNDFYMFDPKQINFGTLNETPCCGYCNYGQFGAMVEKGDVLGIFSGHDHTNAFGVKNKGIDIANSLSTRFNGDRFSTQYGYRIINVNENDTSVYTSRIIRWYNMFTLRDIKTFAKQKNKLAKDTALAVTLKGLIQRFHTKTGRTFSSLVTGRQVTYKD